MKFSIVKSIDVTLEQEEKEILDKAQAIIDNLKEKMRESSLYIAECQDEYDGDIYNLEFDELSRTSFCLEKLQDITDIC